jgi:hypothetical protein
MSFRKQSEIELPLLKLLHEFGGKAEPKELYPRLATIFPQLTEDDLTARLPSSPSTLDGIIWSNGAARNSSRKERLTVRPVVSGS